MTETLIDPQTDGDAEARAREALSQLLADSSRQSSGITIAEARTHLVVRHRLDATPGFVQRFLRRAGWCPVKRLYEPPVYFPRRAEVIDLGTAAVGEPAS